MARGRSLYDMGQQNSEVPLKDAKKGSDSHFVFWKYRSGFVESILEFDGLGGCCNNPGRR